jgi:hypothetical protein
MATDAAAPKSQHFPGGILVSRVRGMIRAITPAPDTPQ